VQAYLPRTTDTVTPAPRVRDAARDMVLLVSTSLDDRLRYEASLHNTRYRSTAAATVREAKSVLAVSAASAVILDMQSGREECWTWLAELRHEEKAWHVGKGSPIEGADAHQRRVPVIVLSDIDQGDRAQSLGADAFFIKPLSGTELLTSLDAMLSAP
jgi:DNA-binding response OmpR family regulator